MTTSNPLRRAAHAVPLAALSLLLLSAGMCRQADEPPAPETAEQAATAEIAEPAPEPQAPAGPTPAELAEQERQAAIAAAEQELAEREAALAAEEERLRQERQLQDERQRLAAEQAAAAERERQLAARERELREREAELARRQQELPTGETEATIVIEPAEPEPLPEPTGNYEGNFDEPWRESQQAAGEETAEPTAERDESLREEPAPPEVALASVQAGERMEVQIVEPLTSQTARVGDTFSTRLVQDLRDSLGRVVIPAGSEVLGRVTEVTPYRRGGGPATLGVEFTDIVVSAEQTVGIRARFVELGADRKNNRKKVVAGAVVGAILGHILGGDGSKNVIIGAAAGAAAGGAVVANAKDRDAEIPAGQIIALELEEVVTVEIEYGAIAPR